MQKYFITNNHWCQKNNEQTRHWFIFMYRYSKCHSWSTKDKLGTGHVFGMLWPIINIAYFGKYYILIYSNIKYQPKLIIGPLKVLITAAVIRVNNFLFIKWLLKNNSLFSQQLRHFMMRRQYIYGSLKRLLTETRSYTWEYLLFIPIPNYQ